MSGPEPFKLHAEHPALELVNTLDMRFSAETIELIPTYRDLLRLCTQLKLMTADQARRLGAHRRGKGLHRRCWHLRLSCARRWQRFSTAGLTAASFRTDKWKYSNGTSMPRRCIAGWLRTIRIGTGVGPAWSGTRRFHYGCWPRARLICWSRVMRSLLRIAAIRLADGFFLTRARTIPGDGAT